MTDPKLVRRLAGKTKKATPGNQVDEGLMAAAAKNREREARLSIIAAYGRLGIPYGQWPACVRGFHTDPQQRIEYHQFMTPLPFQAPEFDRLSESANDWAKKADRAWELHRSGFLQECRDWVSAGLDEEIVEPKRARFTGKNLPARAGRRSRERNTPSDRRNEWAARYLLKVPLKEIAGANADATSVGRIAREIIRLAGWVTRSQRAGSRGEGSPT